MPNIQHGQQAMMTAHYLLGPTQDCVLRFKGKFFKRRVIPICFTVLA